VAITVYGRRVIRAIERETGERIVHAAGLYATTVDHRHLQWVDGWTARPWTDAADCGVRLSSCRTLFGVDELGAPRHFMAGACTVCHVGPGEPHRHWCGVLLDLLGWPSINPDYWPKPVHRPMWMDGCVRCGRLRQGPLP